MGRSAGCWDDHQRSVTAAGKRDDSFDDSSVTQPAADDDERSPYRTDPWVVRRRRALRSSWCGNEQRCRCDQNHRGPDGLLSSRQVAEFTVRSIDGSTSCGDSFTPFVEDIRLGRGARSIGKDPDIRFLPLVPCLPVGWDRCSGKTLERIEEPVLLIRQREEHRDESRDSGSFDPVGSGNAARARTICAPPRADAPPLRFGRPARDDRCQGALCHGLLRAAWAAEKPIGCRGPRRFRQQAVHRALTGIEPLGRSRNPRDSEDGSPKVSNAQARSEQVRPLDSSVLRSRSKTSAVAGSP